MVELVVACTVSANVPSLRIRMVGPLSTAPVRLSTGCTLMAARASIVQTVCFGAGDGFDVSSLTLLQAASGSMRARTSFRTVVLLGEPEQQCCNSRTGPPSSHKEHQDWIVFSQSAPGTDSFLTKFTKCTKSSYRGCSSP